MRVYPITTLGYGLSEVRRSRKHAYPGHETALDQRFPAYSKDVTVFQSDSMKYVLSNKTTREMLLVAE